MNSRVYGRIAGGTQRNLNNIKLVIISFCYYYFTQFYCTGVNPGAWGYHDPQILEWDRKGGRRVYMKYYRNL